MLFPDDCRICAKPLRNISRIPVCPACLAVPRPLVADRFCVVCQSPFVEAYPLDGQDICMVCRGGKPSYDATYSYGSYDGALRELIRLFKYSRIESLSKPLGQLMVRAIPRHLNFDFVMPMPMHWYRQWRRGFNQAELLARPVARLYGTPVSRHLRRVRLGKVQAGLGAEARRENLKRAFQVKRTGEIAGKKILLIDDVLTTGSTLHAAAAALKAAGAAQVVSLTLARVVRQDTAGRLSGQRFEPELAMGIATSEGRLRAEG